MQARGRGSRNRGRLRGRLPGTHVFAWPSGRGRRRRRQRRRKRWRRGTRHRGALWHWHRPLLLCAARIMAAGRGRWVWRLGVSALSPSVATGRAGSSGRVSLFTLLPAVVAANPTGGTARCRPAAALLRPLLVQFGKGPARAAGRRRRDRGNDRRRRNGAGGGRASTCLVITAPHPVASSSSLHCSAACLWCLLSHRPTGPDSKTSVY